MGRATQTRVVVVDDDEAFLRAITRTVRRRNPSVALHAFSDSRDGLRFLERHPVDLAIVDVYMPQLDGLEICHLLHGRIRATLILSTSRPSVAIRNAALLAGAASTIEKPFDVLDVVAARVRSVEYRDGLIASHVSLAHDLAGRFARVFGDLVPDDELRAAARVGLVAAADRFDPDRGEPFVAFAAMRIRGAIVDELRRHGAYSRGRRGLRRRISSARAQLRRPGHEPNDLEIAMAIGTSVETVAHADEPTRVTIARRDVDIVVDEDAPRATHLRALLLRARGRLLAIEDVVLVLHYIEELTFDEIAKRLGLSPPTVRRVHDRALAILRRLVGT